MSTFGRYFRGLTAYDLLGNVIPGLILLSGVFGLLPVTVENVGIVEASATLVTAFVLGGFVQRHASKATGNRKSFELTIKATEKPTRLEEEPEPDEDEANDSENASNSESRVCTCVKRLLSFGIQVVSSVKSKIHDYTRNKVPLPIRRVTVNSWVAVIHPLRGWKVEQGEELDDAVLTGVIRQHLLDTHGIPRQFDDFQVLYHLMISRIDESSGPNRAIRIQGLRNFYRGVWIATWWFGVALVIALVASWCFEGVVNSMCTNDWRMFQWEYQTPNFRSVWTPTRQLLLPTVAVIYLARRAYESQEEDFIEYLFTDYATAVKPDREDFPTEFSHDVTHSLSDTASGDSQPSEEKSKRTTDDQDVDDGLDSENG